MLISLFFFAVCRFLLLYAWRHGILSQWFLGLRVKNVTKIQTKIMLRIHFLLWKKKVPLIWRWSCLRIMKKKDVSIGFCLISCSIHWVNLKASVVGVRLESGATTTTTNNVIIMLIIIVISKFLAHDNDFPAFWLVP